MNLIKYGFVLTLLTSSMASLAADHDLDAKSGTIFSDAEGDYHIRSNIGGGSGITLNDTTTSIRSLHHDAVKCDAVVNLADSQSLKCSALSVQQAQASLKFAGNGSSGVFQLAETEPLRAEVGAESKLVFNVPFAASKLIKLGGGDLYFSKNVSSEVTNDNGMVCLPSSEQHYLGISSVKPFVLHIDNTEQTPNQLLVDQCDNGGAGIAAELTPAVASDTVAISLLSVGGGSDVSLPAQLTLLQSAVGEELVPSAVNVPECVIVGSNSVGVLRISGKLCAKLAIAEGEVALSKGAVYIASGSVVTNCSAEIGEPLLGRSGYAALDVAGDYTAFGGWQGAVAGQLSLNVSGMFRHPSAEDCGSGFTLGGSDACAAITVDGGVFDAQGLTAKVSLPMNSAAKSVVLTVENEGSFNLGTNQLALGQSTVVNVNGGAILSAKSVTVDTAATLQLDGGYLFSSSGDFPFSGKAYAQSQGFGIEVPSSKTVTVDSSNRPIAANGEGVESIELGAEVPGRKFIAPPLVLITDAGTGKGATAVVELTDGEVTAIRITGRGVGYISPSAVLVYGDETIELGAVYTSDNSAGPLLKRGDGTLDVSTALTLHGLKVYGGTVRALTGSIVAGGPLYLAEGATFNINNTGAYTFSNFEGRGSILNGTVTISALKVDAEGLAAKGASRLDFNHIVLDSSAKITIDNFAALDRGVGSYPLYDLVGTIPATLPMIAESTYKAGLSRNWQLVREGNQLVLRYHGGSLFSVY